MFCRTIPTVIRRACAVRTLRALTSVEPPVVLLIPKQHSFQCQSRFGKQFSSKVTHHDLGGNTQAFGPIVGAGEKAVKDLLAWEQQCHSLFAVLASKKIISTDELRRAVEALTPEQYQAWSYYEKWTAAMVSLLLEHQVVSRKEMQHALFGDYENESTNSLSSSKPLFQTGDFVRVKDFLAQKEWKRPHIRTPGYIYGVAGTIERVCGRHGDPSFLAFGFEAPIVQLYRVRFQQRDIWPEQYQSTSTTTLDVSTNEVTSPDVVEVEVYEHWLEPTDRPTGHSFSDQDLLDHSSGDDCNDHDHHSHHHRDEHGDHDHGHSHDPRSSVESTAILREGPPTPGKELFQSLFRLLIEKNIVSADEIRLMSERMDAAFENLDGASLVVKAWMDPTFEKRLLEDAPAAAKVIGINTSNPNAPTVLTVIKNTQSVHNLIVCTLCSCYPSGLLGIAPSWYKSREYRSRAVREPRKVLHEFGLSVPLQSQIRVHDSTADHRYLVLPARPKDTEGWSEEELKKIVTRDTMLGVAIPEA